MENIVIETFQKKDTREAARMLALAFDQNPNTKAVWKDPTSEKAHKAFAKTITMAVLDSKFNHVYIAKHENRIVGVINYWYWPRCQPSLIDQIRMFPKSLFILGRALPRAAKIKLVWKNNDPQKPHCHIDPLAVLPGFKGKGIGSLLLKHVLQITDAEEIPAYLETDAPRNVPLYERHGFKMIKEVQVHDYPTWLMWRDVREKNKIT